jgi:hypothetical protein
MLDRVFQRIVLFSLLVLPFSVVAGTFEINAQGGAGGGATPTDGRNRAGGSSNTPPQFGYRIGTGPRLLPLRNIDGVTMIGAGMYRITDPRPLARVAELLQQKFGVPISYEEEELRYAGDLISASELPQNRELVAKNPSWKGPIGPKNGTIELSLPIDAIIRQIGDPSEFINQAIQSHQQQKNVGSFKLVKLADHGYSIVMDRVANQSGKIEDCNPPLDTLVSFPEKYRSLRETLGVIADELAAAGKKKIGMGGPFEGDFLESTYVTIGANNETARSVMARALRRAGQPLQSWTLSVLSGAGSIVAFRTVYIEAVDFRGQSGLQEVLAPQK